MTIDIVVMKAVNAENAERAAEVRAKLSANNVLALNMMSSPGSGKTTLLEATFRHMAGRLRFAVIEGDVFTSIDAQRIAAHGVQVVQVNTEGSCHMTAHMIEATLPRLDTASIDVLVIENIGNLICPAGFDLGEHRRVACLSTPEGADKPEKYPKLFTISDATLITKVDLARVLGYDLSAVSSQLQRLNPDAPVITTSATDGTGIEKWCNWLAGAHEAVTGADG